MSGITCANCGTSVEYGMKFCRQCGIPLDASEAATRSFDEPVRVESTTQPTSSSPTSPTFSPPSYAPPAQTPATNSLEQTGQKKTVWILASVAVISLVAVIVLVVMLLNKPSSDTPATGRGGETTQPQGPLPPPPPPPPGQPGAPEISDSLRYPGSQETMRLGEPNGKRVLGLRTSDPLDKVVEYYKTNLGFTNQVSAGRAVILTSSDVAITIAREDNGTSIIIASGRNLRPGRQ